MNINQELNKLMVEYIKRTGHNKTGSLARSIQFNAKISSDGGIDLGLTANDYVLFLDEGRFIDNFLSQGSVKALISNFIVDSLFKS